MAWSTNQYLVFINNRMDDESFVKLLSAYQVFDRMDMSDCSDEEIAEIYLVRPGKKRKLVKCNFNGTWHNFKEPLLMTITDKKGRVLEYDYGTDH